MEKIPVPCTWYLALGTYFIISVTDRIPDKCGKRAFLGLEFIAKKKRSLDPSQYRSPKRKILNGHSHENDFEIITNFAGVSLRVLANQLISFYIVSPLF
jgi:hypothetical protein